MTRRELARILAAGAAGRVLRAENTTPVWSKEWDRAIVESAVAELDRRFDPKENMIALHRGAEYNYHSALRNTSVHPTRDSVTYALLLLEAGGKQRIERAARVIDRTIALQDTDPKSRFYGIWGYYMEEPPPQMQPADFNWADFNGAQLLMIEARHGAELPGPVRARMHEAIHHAAYSVRRRNVTMSYTNIAVQGTFVTLAAAAILKDDDLSAYAHDRLRRFAQQVDLTGSFDEYNSPTYIEVTIANLTRMRMVLKEESVLALAAKIEQRAWKHIGEHWHVATRQLAGPMSRCYSTDIGQPLWLQKALNGAVGFATLDEAKRHPGEGDAGILDFHCPVEIAPLFIKSGEPRQHREIFRAAQPPIVPVEGTTWLDSEWCLGSVNRGNFWVQSRPILAYWGGPRRPAHYLQPRFVKDDYDFSSGLVYTVQDRGWLLGLVTFQTDGGDKHPSLDRIKNGEFKASRFRLRFDFAGLPPGSPNPAESLNLDGTKLRLQVRHAELGAFKARTSWGEEDGVHTLSVDFIEPGESRTLRWADLKTAYAVFTITMGDKATGEPAYHAQPDGSNIKATWGDLELEGRITPASLAEQDEAFAARIGGKPVPLTRLSEEKLLA